jgi:hypothetical protein
MVKMTRVSLPQAEIANFRADDAKLADFCEVLTATRTLCICFEFLLTANHKQSERCFACRAEDAFKERAVFQAMGSNRG